MIQPQITSTWVLPYSVSSITYSFHILPKDLFQLIVMEQILLKKKKKKPLINLFFQHSCSVLEYVEGKWVCEGAGPPGGLGVNTARKYLRDIVSGLIYLHAHVWLKDIYLFIQHILYAQKIYSSNSVNVYFRNCSCLDYLFLLS